MLTGVTMELAGAGGPATVIAGVTLTVGPDGFTVAAPSGPPTEVPWSVVGWARCGESGLLDDGAPAVAVAATAAGRLVRWLVPEDQMPPARAMAIDHLLTARTGARPADDAPLDPGGVPGAAPLPFALPPVAGLRERRERSRRPLGVMVAWLAILALVLVGAGLLVASSIRVPGHPGAGAGPAHARQVAKARALARAVGLRVADLPAGWTAVSTPSGPLSGFVDSGLSSAPPGSSEAASRYDRCLGVGSAAVPLVSVSGHPLAQTSSGAFAGPATAAPMQVASITSVYGTRAPVRRAVRQLEHPGFASCFGSAVGEELARSLAAQEPSGVTTGRASSQNLPLPRWAGIRATGVELKVPLDVRGEATSVQLGFVFVTGSTVEATLVSFSTTGVPQSISQSLAATLEEEMAASGAA